jgi:hypothetical protein
MSQDVFAKESFLGDCWASQRGWQCGGGAVYSERRGSSLGTPIILELGPFWSSVLSMATTRISTMLPSGRGKTERQTACNIGGTK